MGPTDGYGKILAYAFSLGLWVAAIALSSYAIDSGLIQVLAPFTGLRVIVYSFLAYCGVISVCASYLARRRIPVMLALLAGSVLCFAAAAEGLVGALATPTLQRKLNGVSVSLDILEAIAFAAAIIIAFSRFRKAGGKPNG